MNTVKCTERKCDESRYNKKKCNKRNNKCNVVEM